MIWRLGACEYGFASCDTREQAEEYAGTLRSEPQVLFVRVAPGDRSVAAGDFWNLPLDADDD